jgi:alpha-glucosidase
MDIRKIIYIIRAIGFSGIIRTIQYGLSRDKIVKQATSKSSLPYKLLEPGKIKHFEAIQSGARLNYENSRLEVVFLTHNMVKVSWEPGKNTYPYTIYRSEWDQLNPEINHQDTFTSIYCGNLKLIITNNGGVCFYNLDGKIIKQDNPPKRSGEEWTLSTILSPEEHIYALGERASSFNLRAGGYCSWNTDVGGSYHHGDDPLYIGTPIYLSLANSGSYLVYFENSYRSNFHINDTLNATFSGGTLRYYIIYGSLDIIYSQLAELIGRPNLAPLWSLGYHQSRWGYSTESDIRNVIEGFKKHDFPISAIHLDIDYMKQYRIFTVNSTHYPDMRKLTSELLEKGIKVIASINPAVKLDPNYSVYEDGISKDVFCKQPNGEILHGVSWPGWSVFPDFTQPKAREWWKEQYKRFLDEGIAGIWHDMNEPASFAAWGDKSFPVSTLHDMEGQGGNHLEAHNLYGLLMNKAGYEALQEYAPDKRPWILSRAGWAGLQRFAWNWTGDVETSWEALHQTIPTILGLGLSGHAFSGVDIGGFSGSPGAELYLRWFQMATFLPFFRTHSAIGTKPREPWVFGEPYTSIIRKFIKLRYKLLPYFYTLSWETSQTGFPPVRPLLWENPIDHNLWDVDDEFMLGDSLLIAPILEEKANSRQITLPQGLWHSIWDDQQLIGSNQFEFRASLETIPIFVKGGTILPMDEEGEFSLHVYPGNDKQSSNQLYTDAGDGYGSWRVDIFQLINKPNGMDIIRESTGDYPCSFPSMKIQLHGKSLTKVSIDGNLYPIQGNSAVIPIFNNLNLEFN